ASQELLRNTRGYLVLRYPSAAGASAVGLLCDGFHQAFRDRGAFGCSSVLHLVRGLANPRRPVGYRSIRCSDTVAVGTNRYVCDHHQVEAWALASSFSAR